MRTLLKHRLHDILRQLDEKRREIAALLDSDEPSPEKLHALFQELSSLLLVTIDAPEPHELLWMYNKIFTAPDPKERLRILKEKSEKSDNNDLLTYINGLIEDAPNRSPGQFSDVHCDAIYGFFHDEHLVPMMPLDDLADPKPGADALIRLYHRMFSPLNGSNSDFTDDDVDYYTSKFGRFEKAAYDYGNDSTRDNKEKLVKILNEILGTEDTEFGDKCLSAYGIATTSEQLARLSASNGPPDVDPRPKKRKPSSGGSRKQGFGSKDFY